MSLDPSVRDAILATVPSLRAFAISLCGNVDRADDLVQETLLRAHIRTLVMKEYEAQAKQAAAAAE